MHFFEIQLEIQFYYTPACSGAAGKQLYHYRMVVIGDEGLSALGQYQLSPTDGHWSITFLEKNTVIQQNLSRPIHQNTTYFSLALSLF